jgi:hypothetical protein
LKDRANRAKSGSVNFSRRLSRRTTIKKYQKEKDAGVSIRRLTDDGMRHGGDSSYRRDADRKIGPSPEGFGPQGGGPRYLLAFSSS